MTASPVLRAALLGAATGGRSTLGIAGPVLTSPLRWPVGLAAVAAVAGELVADKLPGTPSRTIPPSVAVRLASGAAGGALLARRGAGGPVLPVLAAVAGAAAGTLAGARWRGWAAPRTGPLPAALVEDGLVLGLTALACGPRHSAAPGRTRRGRGTMGA